MQPGGESCHVCGCHWSKHMHVTYENIMVEKDGEDEHARKKYACKTVA